MASDEPPDVVPNIIPPGEHIHLLRQRLATVDLTYCGDMEEHGMSMHHPGEVRYEEQRFICRQCLRYYKPIIPFDDPGHLAALEW